MSRYAFETFSYEEAFSQAALSKLPAVMKVPGTRKLPLLHLIRVLSGTVSIIHNYDGKKIQHRVNYLDGDFKVSFLDWHEKFPFIISEDTDIQDVAEYIDATKFTNVKFYENILSEVSQFILHTGRGSHTSAFIYVYRILEKISYAFPLIYCQQTSDYLRSFSQLKDMMIGDKDKSELGFFKVFINNLFEESDLKLTSINIIMNAPNDVIQEKMFSAMFNVCSPQVLNENTDRPRMLAINFCDFGSFIISIRNRFFHYKNEGGNIDSNSVVDSDSFFECINKYALQWLGGVFITILTHNMSEMQKVISLSQSASDSLTHL
ncbi:hypothetical protein SM871_004157 [Yersinia enterocolitica]